MEAIHDLLHGLKRSVGDSADRASMSVVATLHRAGPLRPSDLAERIGLDGSTVSRHVSHLVDQGLVERAPDLEDARAQLLLATPAGRALLDRFWAERAAALDAVVGTWSATDRRRLVSLLRRLADALAVPPGPERADDRALHRTAPRHHRTESRS